MEALLNLISLSEIHDSDKILVIFDDKSAKIIQNLENNIDFINFNIEYYLDNSISYHGKEPCAALSEKIYSSKLCICLTEYSLAHTAARKKFTDNNGLFLSMPGLDYDLIEHPALGVNFKEISNDVERVTRLLNQSDSFSLQSGGYLLKGSIRKRRANCCPGFVNNVYSLGSPPDIEANISPIETSVSGSFIVDGSITLPEIGCLEETIKIDVNNGVIKQINASPYILKILDDYFGGLKERKTIAELGIGFNPKAGLNGSMLFDEGALGFVHLGFGDNSTVGGNNRADTHIDFVLKPEVLTVDNTTLIRNGVIIYGVS